MRFIIFQSIILLLLTNLSGAEKEIPYSIVQKNNCGRLIITQIYISYPGLIKAEIVYENITDTVFCRVDIRATAYDYEGTIIGVGNGGPYEAYHGLIRPGMSFKLEISTYLQGNPRELKNIVFSLEKCYWRDKDNPGLKK